ncbi:hypothetical protein [Microbulbifer taiwanensis]|uniref:hypothetical protein n=1 Tax=Microbulbifer taiwanensis TaxID=986746 RepID=UPI003620E212
MEKNRNLQLFNRLWHEYLGQVGGAFLQLSAFRKFALAPFTDPLCLLGREK